MFCFLKCCNKAQFLQKNEIFLDTFFANLEDGKTPWSSCKGCGFKPPNEGNFFQHHSFGSKLRTRLVGNSYHL